MGHTRKRCLDKVYCEKCKTTTHATISCKKTQGYQPRVPLPQGTKQQGYQPRVPLPQSTNQRATGNQVRKSWQDKSQTCFRTIEELNAKRDKACELSKICTREMQREENERADTMSNRDYEDIEAELAQVEEPK